MFLVRWAGWLLSLPLVWLGQGAAMLGQPLCVPLLKAAWRTGGDGNIALAALARIQQHVSPEAARRHADEWLAWRPQPEIAAYSGLLAAEAGDREMATQLLARGQQLGRDRAGMLELLELMLADSGDDPQGAVAVARRLAQHDDLSPSVSRLIHQQLLWEAIGHGQWDEVQRRAEHLWSIEDDPLAATALWLLGRRRGEQHDLRRQLERLAVPPATRLQMEVAGYTAAGDVEQARQALAQLREVAPRAADHLERVVQAKEASA